jgi:hypothetical protein
MMWATIRKGNITPVSARRKPTKIIPNGDRDIFIDTASKLPNVRVLVQNPVEI